MVRCHHPRPRQTTSSASVWEGVIFFLRVCQNIPLHECPPLPVSLNQPAPVDDDPALRAEWAHALAAAPHARGSWWRPLRRAALATTLLPKTTSGGVLVLKQARRALGQAPAAVDDDTAALLWAMHP